jgi:mannosyltransferase OCH1-like enzyme
VSIRPENRLTENDFLSATADNQNITHDADAFEPLVEEDFPTIESQSPRITHIIHFIFITGIKEKHGIPSIFKDNVLSFYNSNPNWTYYFWSDVSARDLIASRQPELLSTFDNYSRVIMKADAFRYVLLYEFGGVYVDLDIKCLRPLDRATIKYSCILTPEPFEHSAMLYKMPYILSTALMLCRPKHPFFKQLIEALPKSAYLSDVIKSTGPLFLTPQFNKYIKSLQYKDIKPKPSSWSNTPYFYNNVPSNEHNDALFVANTQYFMSAYDPGQTSFFQSLCYRNNNGNDIVNRGCKLWKSKRTEGLQNPFVFTDHDWKHLYSIDMSTQMISIQTLIPKIKEFKNK